MEYNIENEKGIGVLIQGKGNYCSKLKRGKLKTKKLLKITILGEQEHSIQKQTDPKHCQSDVEEVCIYQNQESGHHSRSENSGFHTRKNPKQ